MRSLLQDITGIVLAIGVLVLACQSTLKKLFALIRYARKMSAAVLPAQNRQASASANRDQPQSSPQSRRKDILAFAAALLVTALMLSWDLASPASMSRMDVAGIAVKVGCLFAIVLVQYFSRYMDAFDTLVHSLELHFRALHLLHELSKEEPNKAPEPTTMAVTPRAPSSTSRASHGRGSS